MLGFVGLINLRVRLLINLVCLQPQRTERWVLSTRVPTSAMWPHTDVRRSGLQSRFWQSARWRERLAADDTNHEHHRYER